MADAQAGREELKRFLKARRERITPKAAGLVAVGRRRTGGLTREDVAQLAGVSFKWYTLFESGAAPGISRRLLDRVSNALRLNRVERRYLFSLWGFAAATDEDADAAPDLGNLRRLIDELTGAPSAVYTPTFDVLYHNDAYDALFRHTDRPPGLKANKMWRLFMDDQYKALWRNWEALARHVTSEFRFLNSSNEPTPAFRALLEQLQGSPDFNRLWSEGDVDVIRGGTAHFELDVPDAGLMVFDAATMIPPEGPHLYFTTLIPTDAETREKLCALVRGRKLRAAH